MAVLGMQSFFMAVLLVEAGSVAVASEKLRGQTFLHPK